MSKRDKYAPDYHKLYPNVTITPAVMKALDQSDRKIQYFELDLKTERERKNLRTKAVTVTPAREDSLERLLEDNDEQYALDSFSPEESLMEQDELARLHHALNQLRPDEQYLIHAIFYERIGEATLGKKMGLTQQAISYRVKTVCRKLKKIMES